MDQGKRPPLTLAEAADELGVTTRVVRNALRRKELLGFRIGRYLRLDPESVEKKRRGENAAAE